jgi:hypothetical protein
MVDGSAANEEIIGLAGGGGASTFGGGGGGGAGASSCSRPQRTTGSNPKNNKIIFFINLPELRLLKSPMTEHSMLLLLHTGVVLLPLVVSCLSCVPSANMVQI